MDWLLDTYLFREVLSATQIKMIIFLWKIVKCTLLLLINVKILRFIVSKLFQNFLSRTNVQERKQQLITLKTIILHALEAVIFIIYLGNILNILGIDVRPILATAGVMGVAVGFGAKRFVEDIISGIIIIIEGQIRVGDYVEIGALQGTVEKITLPLITVRSGSTGALCYIRCGYIDTVINHTMNYSYSTFELDVAYKEDMEHVFKTLNKCFDILVSNEDNRTKVIGDLEIMGLDAFKESSVCVRARIKTQPKEQWYIKREFNRIVKERFEMENIEIPFNQLVISNLNQN